MRTAHAAVERARQPAKDTDPLELLRQERAFERSREQLVRTFLARADECDPDEIEDDDLYNTVIEDTQLADRGQELAEENRALAQRARVARDATAVMVLVQYAKADLEHERRWYLGQLAQVELQLRYREAIEAEAEEVDLEPEGRVLPRWAEHQNQSGRYTPVAPPALPTVPAFRGPTRPEPPGAALAQLRGFAYPTEPSPPPRPPPIEQFANWLAHLVGIAQREPSRRPC